jgi:hypothetical protein
LAFHWRFRDVLNPYTILQNTNNRTAFRIVREAEIAGAVLSSNLTRESIVYSAEFLKGDAYVQTKETSFCISSVVH